MINSIRVAMIIQAYYPRLGGAERQLASLAPLLQQSGVELIVLTRRYARDLSSFEMIHNVPVYRLPVPGPKPIAALAFSLCALPILQCFKPDVVHAHELLSPATTAVMAKQILRTPVAAKVLRGGALGDIAKLKNRAFGLHRIAALKRNIDAFIVISQEIDRELSGIGVSPDKRIFIPNGVDLARFAPFPLDQKTTQRRLLKLPDGLVVVFSGRLDPEKRVEFLVELWPAILERHPEANLLILGTGSDETKLRKLAGANVVFGGSVEDVAPYLASSDIFVLPSSTEGLSNSLLEAMGSSLPVIATSVGGATDLITPDQNGILIPPEDKLALKDALFVLLSDAEKRAKFGALGHEVVQQNYSLSTSAEKLKSLYEKMIARAKSLEIS
jgi:glycosyltransferase involved in cell wall biosynthesis